MNAFEVVTLVVAVVAIVLSVTVWLRLGRVVEQLGRHGQTWFDHESDIDPADRPSEDDRDAPIPKRPLRGRVD
jgi:hypothetical protein